MTAYRDSRRRPIQLGPAIGRGGEATVFNVAGRTGLVAKVYERPPRSEYARKLLWMRDHPPADPTASQQHASLAWPVEILFDSNGKLAGYLMPLIERAVPLLDVFNPRRCAEVLPEFNRRYLHRTARNLSAAIGALHARGYVVGDINESNILVTPSALVSLIDTDSFQVRETTPSGTVLHTCPVARQEYTPPELQGKSLQNTARSPEQDAFGLGVLLFQLLMAGNHPFRAQWLGSDDPPPLEERIRRGCFPYRNPPVCPVAPPPISPAMDDLYPGLARLMVRCFVDGHRNPRRRPKPEHWEKIIAEAEKNLVLCRNGHYFSNHLHDCPVCNPRTSGRQIPLPAITQSRPASQPSGQHRNRPANVPSSSPAPPQQTARSIPGWLQSAIPWLQARPTRRRLPRLSFRFDRQILLESLGQGVLLGAGGGALIGSLLAFLTWIISQDLHWRPLVVAGMLLAAAWRSIQIGRGVSFLIVRTIGWELALKGTLTTVLSFAGGYIGWLMNASILAVAIGVFMGGISGWLVGDVIWDRGSRVRWEWVGTSLTLALFSWLALLGGRWLTSGWFGEVSGSLVAALAAWGDGQEISRGWISAAIGAMGGGIGGLLSGGLVEVIAEVFGFRK